MMHAILDHEAFRGLRAAVSLAIFLGACGGPASGLPSVAAEAGRMPALAPSAPPARSVSIAFTGFGRGVVDPTTITCTCGREELSSEGGLARRATLLKQLRTTEPGTLVVDTGGTLVASTGAGAQTDLLLIKAMSTMGYDALNVGQGEVLADSGGLAGGAGPAPTFVASTSRAAPATHASAPFVEKPYLVREVAGTRVGILGITSSSQPGSAQDATGPSSPADAIRPVLAQLRKEDSSRQPTLVVVLADLDPPGVQSLAEADLGVQVVLGGRDVTPRDATRDGSAIVASAGGDGLYVGHVALALDEQGRVVSFEGRTSVLDGNFREDPEMVSLRNQYR